MKKKFFIVAFIFVFAVLYAEPKIIDWKVRTLGGDAYPKWLYMLVEKNNAKQFMRDFDIKKSESIVWAVSTNSDKDFAILLSEKEAKLKYLEEFNVDESHFAEVNGLQKVITFWIKILDGNEVYYKATSVYKYSSN